MLEFLSSLLVTWPIQLVFGLIFAVPTILITRKWIVWYRGDAINFFVPWMIWLVLFAFGPRDASLTSAICENTLLGFAIGLNFVVFAFTQKLSKPFYARPWPLVALCVFAAAMWAMFPFLGE